MKRDFLRTAIVCLFAVVALCSCDKDDNKGNNVPTEVIVNNTITATVENSNGHKDKVDSVRLIDENRCEAANSVYSDGKFTLKLPSINDTLLDTIFMNDIPAGVTVSDSVAMVVDAYIDAYKSGKKSGAFYHGTTEWTSWLIYSNKDVTITGSATRDDKDTKKYNASLEKGWNIVYQKDVNKADGKRESEITTQMPDSAKWHYRAPSNN
jgi:hypothetical protein